MEAQPDYLVSSNIGYKLHITEGLRTGIKMEVVHPIVLIARQLGRSQQIPPVTVATDSHIKIKFNQ